MANSFDINAIRAQFPILNEEVYGKPLVYLDSGASAQKPKAVIDQLSQTYSSRYSNVHRGLHFMSNAATDDYEKAREITRRFINAPSVDQVVFTSSTTAALNLVAYGYAMAHLKEGDEIVLSLMEHHSNIVPWNFLRERMGVKIVWAEIEEDGSLPVENVTKCFTDKTKLIAITHMSNVLGTIVDIKAICAAAKAADITTVVDGSQASVHMAVDVQDLDCDFYAMTGHKLYGPSGIGVLYGKADKLEATQPFMGGGEMISDVSREGVTYNHPPHRFEAGTPPIAQAIGLGAALEFIESIGFNAISAHEHELRDYAHATLSQINALRIFGTTPDKGAIISFEIEGIHAHDISMVIDREGVAVRAGTHCAQPLLKHFGVSSTCRASMAMYNTKAEIDKLAEALEKARKFFA
jgi:cysteine desulfurase/selenocysteine lyase